MKAWASLLLASVACTGTIGGDPGPVPAGGSPVGDQAGSIPSPAGGRGGAGGGPGSEQAGGAPSVPVEVPVCGPGAPALRRLTRDEYDNTVRDLLGDATRPGGGFPADVSASGFENDVKTLSVPPLLVERYEGAAERLVEDLWRREQPLPVGMRRVIRCAPVGDGTVCAREILERFTTRAWRRPVVASEVDRLLRFLQVARTHGEGWDQGLKLALQAVLLSPSFLFRFEAAAPGQPLDDHAIASRLSYFLWASMPDDALFALAARKSLRDPAVLRTEARRLLADPRSDALVSSFAGQWLDLRLVEGVSPDPKLFPTVTPSLKRSMRLETEAFFRAFLQEDRSVLDLLDAPFTFLNDELAQHYRAGWPGSKEVLKLVKLDPWTRRGGLLTHASFLGVTSMPDRTSVVLRGAWVLEQLLCDTPPPPPPDVPPLPTPSGTLKTQRQRTEAHSKLPACAVCHALLDPIGFSLENFDAVGVWRDAEGGVPIDASGTFRGKPFKGAPALAALIKADPAFPACVVEKLYTYAVGRSTATPDEPVLATLGQTFAQKGHRLRELAVEIAASRGFSTSCAEAR